MLWQIVDVYQPSHLWQTPMFVSFKLFGPNFDKYPQFSVKLENRIAKLLTSSGSMVASSMVALEPEQNN